MIKHAKNIPDLRNYTVVEEGFIPDKEVGLQTRYYLQHRGGAGKVVIDAELRTGGIWMRLRVPNSYAEQLRAEKRAATRGNFGNLK